MKPVRRRTLHHAVIDRLRDMIVENELPQGARIDEKALCDLFDISRTPLREALKVLASEGLIELLPNRGARVTEVTERGVSELFEVVANLERMAAEQVAERASDKDIMKLRRAHNRLLSLHATGKRPEYFRLNHKIHLTVIELSGNATLAAIHGQLMTKIRRARFLAITTQERWDESVQEHEALMLALEARDALRAGLILRDHVLKTALTIGSTITAGTVTEEAPITDNAA
jgi:DNA-binding GntR family transcriptional regulator